MKQKITLILILFMCALSYAQNTAPKVDAVRLNAKTTVQMNAFTRAVNGTLCWNDETNSIHVYSDGAWVDQAASGSGVSAADQLKIDNIAITLAVDLDALEIAVGLNTA